MDLTFKFRLPHRSSGDVHELAHDTNHLPRRTALWKTGELKDVRIGPFRAEHFRAEGGVTKRPSALIYAVEMFREPLLNQFRKHKADGLMEQLGSLASNKLEVGIIRMRETEIRPLEDRDRQGVLGESVTPTADLCSQLARCVRRLQVGHPGIALHALA